MSEFARLIALAVVTFLVAMVVTIISNPELTRSVATRLGFDYGEENLFGARMPSPMAPDGRNLAVWRPAPGQWTGLSGFPDSTDVRFPLPYGIDASEGQLQLVLNSQMVAGGDGRVAVWINGVERDVLVIRPGEERRTLVYRLSAGDLAGAEVRVRLTGDGSTNQGRICPSDTRDLGVAVEVDAASALVLDPGEVRPGAEARLSTRVSPLRLEPGEDAATVAWAVWAAQYLPRQGVPAVLGGDQSGTIRLDPAAREPVSLDQDDGLRVQASREGIERVARLRGGLFPVLYQRRWPIRAADLGADTDTASFRGSRRWTLTYRLADLPGGRAPDRLDLALAVSRLAEPSDWNLRVTLNGALIHSSSAGGREERIERAVRLPAWQQGLSNTIEVTLVDPSPNQGICRAGPDAAAQLLPTSELHWVGGDPVNAREALVRHLAETETVALAVPRPLNVVTAAAASRLLGQVLPMTTGIDNEGAGPRITVLSTADLDALRAPSPAESETRFLVYRPAREAKEVRVERLSRSAPVAPSGADDALLLIEW